MIPGIEDELKAALAQASEAIQPRSDLADLVRRATQRRRRARAITIGVAAIAAGSLIAVYGVASSPRRSPADRHAKPPSRLQMGLGVGSTDEMAVDGRWVYLTVGDYPSATLAAFDRLTGRLIRRISIPALPSTVQVGPGGQVWLAFYPDSNGGGTGVWLLSPDLRLRSGVNLGTRRYLGAGAFDVLPLGRNTAMLATDQGLATLRLPPPGQPGKVTLRRQPPVAGARQIQGLPVQLALFAGRVVVRLGSDTGRALIAFSGRGTAVYSPGPADALGPMAASGGGLWTTVFTSNGEVSRGLMRLDGHLRPNTPRSISSDPLLAQSQQVAVAGDAIWAILPGSPSLACFADRGDRVGPVIKVRLRFAPAENSSAGVLGVVGATLYVLDSSGVQSYRVPAACR